MAEAEPQTAPADTERRRALIFESYGWQDADAIALQIKTALESEGYEVWIDRDHLRADDETFPIPLQRALEQANLVVALLSPHSVRLAGDAAGANGASVCHRELIFADQSDKPIVAVKVIDCTTPLAINHYDVIDFTTWHSSQESFKTGLKEIIDWIDHALAEPPHRHYCIYVDNLPRARLPFPEVVTAGGQFVGREWLIHEHLDRWLASNSQCLLIEGEPGSGKTAIVAELVRRNPENRVLAYHFCSLRSPGTTDPQKFVRSIAAMLCGSVPEYRQSLRDRELVRGLQPGDPAMMLREGVLAPLRSIRMEGVRYLLVDALDEAVAPPGDGRSSDMSIPRLLSHTLDAFPTWLRLVATTRRDDRILGLFQAARREFLGQSVAAQQDDLRLFIERRVREPDLLALIGPDEADIRRAVSAIADRAGGNFQYATTVLDEIGHENVTVDAIDRLPRSLVELYARLADLRFPYGTGFEQARKVLGVLLAALQPLTAEQVALITGLDRYDTLQRTIDQLSCFITWDDVGGKRLYRLAHKSIQDWLVGRSDGFDRFRVEPAQGHALILAYCRQWASHRDGYALTHLITHLVQDGELAEALATIRGGFFEQRSDAIERSHDLDDTLNLVLALADGEDAAAILALAQTENTWQRDGVAAALSAPRRSAMRDDSAFVDRVVGALLEVG